MKKSKSKVTKSIESDLPADLLQRRHTIESRLQEREQRVIFWRQKTVKLKQEFDNQQQEREQRWRRQTGKLKQELDDQQEARERHLEAWRREAAQEVAELERLAVKREDFARRQEAAAAGKREQAAERLRGKTEPKRDKDGLTASERKHYEKWGWANTAHGLYSDR